MNSASLARSTWSSTVVHSRSQAGVVAEPLLASPGRSGVMALAEGAGLLVVGLSERWREEGPRPGGLAPAQTRTRFGWSLTAGAP
jgi:hypothetical protein